MSYGEVQNCEANWPGTSGVTRKPLAVPAWRKNRFGQVGPGTDENQWSHTVKLRAKVVMIGTSEGSRHCITSRARPRSRPSWRGQVTGRASAPRRVARGG